MNMKDKFQLKSCWSKRLIFKIRLKLVNGRSRTTIQKCQWNQSTKRISQLEHIFIICTKTFIQYQRHHCSDGLRDCGCFITFTTTSTTTVFQCTFLVASFTTNFWPRAEFLKQKNCFRKEYKHIGSNRKQVFFWSKSQIFQYSIKRKFNIALNFWQPTRMSKFGNLLQQTMSSLENMSNWQVYQSFTDINKKLWTKL